MNTVDTSWVRGTVHAVEVHGELALLDMGRGAWAVVHVARREWLGCCPTRRLALRHVRRQNAGA
jgi:hypothetical protein